MNGETLPPRHGVPLRAVVGGWYGMASVKWLTRIVVTDKPHPASGRRSTTRTASGQDGLPRLVPVTAIQPKAVDRPARPQRGGPAGKPYRSSGAAWAGETASREGRGQHRRREDLGRGEADGEAEAVPAGGLGVRLGDAGRDGARLKSSPGRPTTGGNTQPEKRDPDRRTYMINHLVPVEVTVR